MQQYLQRIYRMYTTFNTLAFQLRALTKRGNGDNVKRYITDTKLLTDMFSGS